MISPGDEGDFSCWYGLKISFNSVKSVKNCLTRKFIDRKTSTNTYEQYNLFITKIYKKVNINRKFF